MSDFLSFVIFKSLAKYYYIGQILSFKHLTVKGIRCNMKFKNKNVLVYGLSSSGEWAAKLLRRCKANVFLYDDNPAVLKSKVIPNCYLVQELNKNLITQFDFLVVSPAIEKNNKNLTIARANGIKIFSEVELAGLFSKNFVAVTGTNGKTTTVELITAILNKKHKATACGNIGYPFSRAVMEHKNHLHVVEVSSFMLENADTFSPHVATILNIEPDHLTRHKSMEEYRRLKLSILKNLTIKDYMVVNTDLKIPTEQNARTFTYSQKKLADVYLKNGYIYYQNKIIVAENELKIKGKHNIYNAMCAICYGLIYNVPLKYIREALIEYSSEKYRINYLGKINQIDFFNDSKSTNIASTLACVDSIKGSIILLLCGSKKGLDYKKLFATLSRRVRYIIAFGEIAEDVARHNEGRFPLETVADLDAAFDFAVSMALSGDSIVFSPSSASYDQFANYEERGRMFNKKVNEYEIAWKKR